MGKIKLIFGIFLIVAIIYLGIELIPPYFANYQFQDYVQTEALQSTYTPQSEDSIRDTVMRKAADLEIPMVKDDLKVVRIGGQANGTVTITGSYVVHIDLPGYPLDLHFNVSSTNKSVF
jgi:hypothetical protein